MDIILRNPTTTIRNQSIALDIIEEYANGRPLVALAEENNISLGILMRTILESSELLTLFEEATVLNKEVLRQKLHNVVESSALSGTTEDAKWLLERLFSTQYGKQTTVLNKNVNLDVTEAVDLDKYVKN